MGVSLKSFKSGPLLISATGQPPARLIYDQTVNFLGAIGDLDRFVSAFPDESIFVVVSDCPSVQFLPDICRHSGSFRRQRDSLLGSTEVPWHRLYSSCLPIGQVDVFSSYPVPRSKPCPLLAVRSIMQGLFSHHFFAQAMPGIVRIVHIIIYSP